MQHGVPSVTPVGGVASARLGCEIDTRRIPRPEPGQTVVWTLQLDHSEAEVAEGLRILSDDERQKASRFRFFADRREFVMARSTLRRLLGAMLGQRPEMVRFLYGAHGKPEVAGHPSLKISVSHSSGLALLAIAEAVSEDEEMGVDLEEVRDIPDLSALAARCFSSTEQAELRALPADARTSGFFRLWVATEARLKAGGMGLAALDDTREACAGFDQSWSVTLLDVGARYMAAVAQSSPPSSIEIRRLSADAFNRC